MVEVSNREETVYTQIIPYVDIFASKSKFDTLDIVEHQRNGSADLEYKPAIILEGRLEIMPDEGCSVSPKCVNCPLPECTYIELGAKTIARQQRDKKIYDDYMERKNLGYRVGILKYLMDQYGLSRYATYAAIRRIRKER